LFRGLLLNRWIFIKLPLLINKSGLIGKNGIDTKAGRAQYQVTGDNFKLAEGQNELSVPLTFEKDGVTYRVQLQLCYHFGSQFQS